MPNKSFPFFALLASLSLPSYASWDLEIDPATYAFKGDSLHIRYTPKSAPQWRFGLGTYSMEMPDALINMNKQNKDKGWQVEITRGLGLFGEYYFSPEQNGWFIGAQLSQQKFSVKREQDASTDFSNGLLMLNLGYKYALGDTGFYLLPWAGVGYTQTLSGKRQREASGFDQNPAALFMTLHLGYKF